MNLTQRVIYCGFAAVAIASAAMPVFASHVPGVRHGPDIEWYASVGEPERVFAPATTVALVPPPREGYIWSPQHWEWNGRRHVWVEGRWVRDDYAEQVAVYNLGIPPAMLAEAVPPRAVIIERR